MEAEVILYANGWRVGRVILNAPYLGAARRKAEAAPVFSMSNNALGVRVPPES